jgi:hypothetical protein
MEKIKFMFQTTNQGLSYGQHNKTNPNCFGSIGSLGFGSSLGFSSFGPGRCIGASSLKSIHLGMMPHVFHHHSSDVQCWKWLEQPTP